MLFSTWIRSDSTLISALLGLISKNRSLSQTIQKLIFVFISIEFKMNDVLICKNSKKKSKNFAFFLRNHRLGSLHQRVRVPILLRWIPWSKLARCTLNVRRRSTPCWAVVERWTRRRWEFSDLRSWKFLKKSKIIFNKILCLRSKVPLRCASRTPSSTWWPYACRIMWSRCQAIASATSPRATKGHKFRFSAEEILNLIFHQKSRTLSISKQSWA